MGTVCRRKPGRPKAIAEGLIPVVMSLYESGLGYRAITRELTKYGVLASFSSVRRVIKQKSSQARLQNIPQANSETILKLGSVKDLTKSIKQRNRCPEIGL
jgi:hypothetical protein